MPSLSESPQKAPLGATGAETLADAGPAMEEDSLVGFTPVVPAFGAFPQLDPENAISQASANNAQACLIRIMRWFRAQFIVDDRSLR
jgi:hypothetical protein